MDSVQRTVRQAVYTSMSDSPVVFLQGARQTGKTTLARSLTVDDTGKQQARYLTLDDASVLAAVQASPEGFIAGIEGPVIIDEVQRVPELALAIKAEVDRRRTPGRFLLTGSADFMVLPDLADSLAGRIEIHTLWPLSQGEIEGRREDFSDAVFAERFSPQLMEGNTGLIDRMVQGGYPEMLTRRTEARRRAWFESYIMSILQRDVRDISNIRDLADLPRLLALAASRAGGLLDYSDLARGLSMPQTTLKRYMGLLQATFLIHTVPAWAVNFGKRLVKSPKLYLNDTAMLLHLVGAGAKRLQDDPMLMGNLMGSVVENFVVMELMKQRGWSESRATLFHFRIHNGDEVDCVLEDGAGRVVGIEVKAAVSVKAADFKGLRVLADAAGDRFVRGIVLYTGKEVVPFGKNLLAVPVEALWSGF